MVGTINGQARTIALNVLNFFENEKSNKKFIIPVDQAVKRACAATGISRSTLLRIKREAKNVKPISLDQSDDDKVVSKPGTSEATSESEPLLPPPILPTPGKKRKKSAKKIELDHFELCALRDLVNNFYTVRKEIPTLNRILKAAKKDLNFRGEKTTLRRMLVTRLGYRFKKCKKAKLQNPDIATIVKVEKPDTENLL